MAYFPVAYSQKRAQRKNNLRRVANYKVKQRSADWIVLLSELYSLQFLAATKIQRFYTRISTIVKDSHHCKSDNDVKVQCVESASCWIRWWGGKCKAKPGEKAPCISNTWALWAMF